MPISTAIPKVTPALLKSTYTPVEPETGFNPADYGTPLFWLDASDAAYVLDSGGSASVNNGKVDKWTDRTGNTRNARQTTDANRPIFKTNQQNSLSVIDFTNTSNQYFTFENSTDVAQNRAGLTLMMVHKPTLQEQYQVEFYIQDNGGADRLSIYVTNQDTTNYKPQADINRTDGGSAYGLYDANSLPYGSWDILFWVFDFANGDWTIYNRNSTVRAETTSGFGGTGSTSNTVANVEPQIAQYSGSYKFNGQMGEMVMWDSALSSGTIGSIKTACGSTKWGLTVA